MKITQLTSLGSYQTESQALAIALDNYKYYDLNLIAVDGAFDVIVAYLMDELSSDDIGRPKQVKKHLESILCNIYRVYEMDETKYVALSRNKNKYALKSRANKVGLTAKIIGVVDALFEKGYLEQHKGFRFKNNRKRTRIIHTEKLRELFLRFGITSSDVKYHEKTECILMRDKVKEDYEYDDGVRIVEHRDNLTRYNNLLEATDITSPYHDNYVFHDKFIRRIFNNRSWLDGGRFYGGEWQRWSSFDRSKILLNGEKTVEVDYSGLHFILVYALIGVDYWKEVGSDPYELEEFKGNKLVRDFFKVVSLILLNAKDEVSALKAINEEVRFKHPTQWKGLKKFELDYKELIEDFKQQHPQLVEGGYLMSGIGVMLQGIDAYIAELVINWFVNENRPVLCIYDSFIVIKDNKEVLESVMVEMFSKVIDGIGIDKQITVRLK